MADDVVRVLDAIRLDAAHVLGTSLGGMIAQELALRHPACVRSLVLAATTAGQAGAMPLRKRGLLVLALSSLLPKKLRTRLRPLATLSHQARRACTRRSEPRRSTHAQNRVALDGLIGQAFAIFAHHTRTRVAQIAVPTLVVHGKADNLIHWQHARILADIIATARLELWPGVGHDLATEAPERLASRVRQHVHDVEQPSRI